ncbi:hypothetical protein ACOBR2_20195 [Telmatobacter bradus]|uniref:hypothetical protein n=1 Tax=Telmatobacter bradus TaxID=474953 RepID=UPI003B4348C2
MSCALVAGGLQLQAASFDLAGPKVDVHIKRGQNTLPIAQAANLQAGDRIWIHPDLPPSQSEHLILVVAFLRGVTNPPPNEWFTRVETWNSAVRSEGVFVTVPAEAQQVLLFLMPETSGDFNTLRKAVHDQPGIFVRAVQDLEAASLDRLRVEAYLNAVKVTSQSDQKTLKERAEMASRSLGIKLDQDCFNKPADQQANCLAQKPEGLVLDDSSTQSRVEQLASGSTTDLMNNISASSMAGGGVYSAYVGAIVDTAKILGSLHTAHFQYIPALALPTGDTLNLRLSTPPSFRNPKSVVVVALPSVGAVKLPPLHPVTPTDSYCAQKPGLVLPAEGAPLVFASELAHDLSLYVEPTAASAGKPLDLPVTADPIKGGLVLTHPAPALPAGELTAELRGKWGFENWVGPHFHLRSSAPGAWTLLPADLATLVVGRDQTLHLEGQETLCVDRIEADSGNGKPTKLVWKSVQPGTLAQPNAQSKPGAEALPNSPAQPNTMELTLPLKDATPGSLTLSIYQFGQEKPQTLTVKTYADAATLERFSLSVDDPVATLKGTRLDEVAKVNLEGIAFVPGELSHVGEAEQLEMKTAGETNHLAPGARLMARVALKDGREMKVAVLVDPARPRVTLGKKGVQQIAAAGAQVRWGSPDDLLLDGRLVFFLKTVIPARFPHDEKVEVAAVDGSFHTLLSVADGGMLLSDAHTAMISFEPLARFGSSAFGPIQVRVVAASGAAGDWLPLGTLVRLPVFKELRCPHAAAKACTLTASNLFLATAFSATEDFTNSVEVPVEFTGTDVSVPHPAAGGLRMKLRDDPDTVQILNLPVLPAAGADSKTTAEATPSGGTSAQATGSAAQSETSAANAPPSAPAGSAATPAATSAADVPPVAPPAVPLAPADSKPVENAPEQKKP